MYIRDGGYKVDQLIQDLNGFGLRIFNGAWEVIIRLKSAPDVVPGDKVTIEGYAEGIEKNLEDPFGKFFMKEPVKIEKEA